MATDILLREFNTLPEQLQSHVIEYIAFLKKSNPFSKKTYASKPNKQSRKAGWGKEVFLYVAPDFDETPIGFEEYTPDK